MKITIDELPDDSRISIELSPLQVEMIGELIMKFLPLCSTTVEALNQEFTAANLACEIGPEPATLGAIGAEPDISLSDVRRAIGQAQTVNRDDTINTITRIRRDFGVDVLDQMSGTQRWMLVQELTKIVDAVSVENVTS